MWNIQQLLHFLIPRVFNWGNILAAGIGAAATYFGGERQNSANSAQSLRQMEFQERMSSTAHQREVADLRAAGLNPILSANAGASSPAGSQATMQNTTASAYSAALQSAQIGKIKADTALTKKQTLAIQPAASLGTGINAATTFGQSSAAELQRHITRFYRNRSSITKTQQASGSPKRGQIDRSSKTKAFPLGSRPYKYNPQTEKKTRTLANGQRLSYYQLDLGPKQGKRYSINGIEFYTWDKFIKRYGKH